MVIKLEDNLYNRHLPRSAAKFKLWRSAGLLLTYKCNASCEFCYYCCSPAKNGLMSVEMVISAWQGLRRLAGDTAKIHLTGGEPFLYWDRLCEILEYAEREKLGRADIIETNGYWAVNDAIVKKRLIAMDRFINKLKISCDPFHQEYVDIEPVKRLAEIASQVLGSDRIMVRWQKYLDNPIIINKAAPYQQRLAGYKQAMQDYPCRFTGRAAGKLAQSIATVPLEQIEGQSCVRAFLDAKSVHIDPFGNVFSGTCSGIILGNINEKPLDEIWLNFNPLENGLIKTLFESGPSGLLDQAIQLGYKPLGFYADKCHLCTSIRQFLLTKGVHRDVIGPPQCYE